MQSKVFVDFSFKSLWAVVFLVIDNRELNFRQEEVFMVVCMWEWEVGGCNSVFYEAVYF